MSPTIAEPTAINVNKVGQLAASPALRAVLGQHAPKFDLAYAMDNRGILIANLAKGQIGEQAARALTRTQITALMARAYNQVVAKRLAGLIAAEPRMVYFKTGANAEDFIRTKARRLGRGRNREGGEYRAVLRSGGYYRHCRQARCRGMAAMTRQRAPQRGRRPLHPPLRLNRRTPHPRC
jgi:hypothetical protein